MKKIDNIKYFLIFLIFGLLLFTYPMILSKFILMPGDLIDGRLINYILEHQFLWLTQTPMHQSFWDMPFYYPIKNTLAFSDALIGMEFIYAPIRFFIKNPQNTLQILYIIMCILNFSSMYLLLRIKFKDLPSAIGAFLFAFSLPRAVQASHLQLYSQFYTIFGILILFSKLKLKYFFALLMFTIQLYTSFYLGWFIAYGAFIYLIVSITSKEERENLLSNFKKTKIQIILATIFCSILLIPFYQHYSNAGTSFSPALLIFPQISDYFSSNSFLDSPIITSLSNVTPENKMGLGFITSALIFIGFVKLKTHKKLLSLFVLLSVSLMTVPILHYIIYTFFPAGGAIRATGRVIFLVLPVFAFFMANFISTIRNKILLAIIIVIFLLEQIPMINYFNLSKTEHNKRIMNYDVPKNCEVIFINYKKLSEIEVLETELDGMWVALKYHIYTVNGYSGFSPTRPSIPLKPECILDGYKN